MHRFQKMVDERMKADRWSYWSPQTIALQFVSECGELVAAIEKLRVNDKQSHYDVVLELGDACYALICLGNVTETDLGEVFDSAHREYFWKHSAEAFYPEMIEQSGRLCDTVNLIYGEKPKKLGDTVQSVKPNLFALISMLARIALLLNININYAIEESISVKHTRDKERYASGAQEGSL